MVANTSAASLGVVVEAEVLENVSSKVSRDKAKVVRDFQALGTLHPLTHFSQPSLLTFHAGRPSGFFSERRYGLAGELYLSSSETSATTRSGIWR